MMRIAGKRHVWHGEGDSALPEEVLHAYTEAPLPGGHPPVPPSVLWVQNSPVYSSRAQSPGPFAEVCHDSPIFSRCFSNARDSDRRGNFKAFFKLQKYFYQKKPCQHHHVLAQELGLPAKKVPGQSPKGRVSEEGGGGGGGMPHP